MSAVAKLSRKTEGKTPAAVAVLVFAPAATTRLAIVIWRGQHPAACLWGNWPLHGSLYAAAGGIPGHAGSVEAKK